MKTFKVCAIAAALTLVSACSSQSEKGSLSTNAIADPTIVTQDNFPQAFTNINLRGF